MLPSVKRLLRERDELHSRIAELQEELNAFYQPPLPPVELQMRISGAGNFTDVGEAFFNRFKTAIGLKPYEGVLDVGCGCGRMAIPLIGYLKQGWYCGFDLDPVSIEWCRTNISVRLRSFHFDLVDLKNTHYNPQGQIDPAAFRFPYPDAHFDFAFLASVFTHTLPAVTRNYLSELHRVLRPGGRCLITYFLINAESRECISSGRSPHPFQPMDDYYVVDPSAPEVTVGYDEAQIIEWHERACLPIRKPVHYGSWAGRSCDSYQDVVIADRPA